MSIPSEPERNTSQPAETGLESEPAAPTPGVHRPRSQPHIEAEKSNLKSWLIGSALAIGVTIGIAGGTGLIPFGFSQGEDVLTAQQEQSITDNFKKANVQSSSLNVQTPQQFKEAIQSMALPADQAQALSQAVAQGDVRLSWLTLRDFYDVDGDVIQLLSGGYSMTIPLTAEPKPFVIPMVQGVPLQVTGVTDGGGGGITLSVATSFGEVIVPSFNEGQTVTIPIR